MGLGDMLMIAGVSLGSGMAVLVIGVIITAIKKGKK